MVALLQGLGVFLASTVVFDVVHEELVRANLLRHVVPEYLTQASFSLLLLAALPPAPVLVALALQTTVFLLIVRCRGKDVNHRGAAVLRAYRPTFFCLPAYHALHHVSPDAYFSSWIKLFDQLAGTGLSLAGRRIAITGASTPFGAALREQIERHASGDVLLLEPGRDFELADVSRLAPVLRGIDVLVLAHAGDGPDAMLASCDSYVAAIETFLAEARGRKLPVEVWAVAHGSAGPRGVDPGERAETLRASREFARQARRFYFDDRVIYRHIAAGPSHPRAAAGRPGAPLAARVAFFFLKKGFNFVPATLGSLAGFSLLRFLLPARPAAAASR